MGLIRTVVREVLGLFVDDVSFALIIIFWIGLAKIFLSRTAFANRWHGMILFLGLALILIESSLRFSRKRRRDIVEWLRSFFDYRFSSVLRGCSGLQGHRATVQIRSVTKSLRIRSRSVSQRKLKPAVDAF
jgi:hypothetical protein